MRRFINRLQLTSKFLTPILLTSCMVLFLGGILLKIKVEKAMSAQTTISLSALNAEKKSAQEALIQALNTKADVIGLFLAKTAPDLILSYDFITLTEFQNVTAADPEVAYTAFLQPNGTPMTAFEIPEEIGEVLEKKYPVEYDGETLAYIQVGMTTAVVERGIQKSESRIGAAVHAVKDAGKTAVDDIQGTMLGNYLLILGLISTLLFVMFRKSILRPLHETSQLILELEKGHLDKRLPITNDDEISAMAQTLNSFADSLQSGVVDALQGLAQGNLTFNATPRDKDDVIRGALKTVGADLNALVARIQIAGDEITLGSAQVSDSSQTLSQGATEQASSLEEISASMNEMGSQTTQNAENAAQANRLSAEVKDSAEKGTHQMQKMVDAMGEINEAGQEISRIIKVIDEIAFQTNLLALNAAVEAARAGMHGKGFAVVAEEVRSLAARSAQAARDTAEKIEGSVKKAEKGAQIADKTAEVLGGIVAGVSGVSDLVAEIAAASNDQAEGLTQIKLGLEQIAQVTLKNTASAEESAAAAEELSGQAMQLRQMLTRFKLKDISSRVAPFENAVQGDLSTAIGWGYGNAATAHSTGQGKTAPSEQSSTSPV